MSGKTIGFAIVGTGMAAEFHEKAILANREGGARLIAVSRRNPAGYPAASARYGVPCLGYDDILRHPDIDCVCLCTPSGMHAVQAIAAAGAGKHALVEKPLALTLADADAMIDAFARAGRLLGCVLQRRAEPLFQRIHQAVQAGDLGSLTTGLVAIPYLRSQAYFDQAEWRGTRTWDGGGILMNQGIHLIDLLLWYMGDPLEIQARAATLQRHIEVEDTAAAVLRFAGGALATITATSTAVPGFPHRVEIYGTRGGIQIEGETVRQWALEDPGSAAVKPSAIDAPAQAGAGADPRAIAVNGHIRLVRNFLGALRGRERLWIPAEEGRRSLSAVLGIYRAAGIDSGSDGGPDPPFAQDNV